MFFPVDLMIKFRCISGREMDVIKIARSKILEIFFGNIIQIFIVQGSGIFIKVNCAFVIVVHITSNGTCSRCGSGFVSGGAHVTPYGVGIGVKLTFRGVYWIGSKGNQFFALIVIILSKSGLESEC